MTDLAIQQPSHFNGSQEHASLTTELAKMLGLVAPVTMSADQQTLWLSSAVETLQGIRASEVANISLEVRRSVTRPSQIVPEIARLVSERRAHTYKMQRLDDEYRPQPALPAPDYCTPEQAAEIMKEFGLKSNPVPPDEAGQA